MRNHNSPSIHSKFAAAILINDFDSVGRPKYRQSMINANDQDIFIGKTAVSTQHAFSNTLLTIPVSFYRRNSEV